MNKYSFPLDIIRRPAKTFQEMDKTGWAWPLGLYILSAAVSALLLATLPPEFIADSFEGISLPRGRGFVFYFLTSAPFGLLFTAFACALLAALAAFLRKGRLSLRLPAAAAAVLASGILAVAARAPGFQRGAGLATVMAASGLAVWSAWSGREKYPAMLKTLLSLSVITLSGDICGGAAALAGSVPAYTAAQYFFSLLSLIWLAKAVSVIAAESLARAASAAVLALLAGAAFLFLLLNLGLMPPELFQVLMLS